MLLETTAGGYDAATSTKHNTVNTKKADSWPHHANSEAYARQLDSADPLRAFRNKFIIPSKAALRSKSLLKTEQIQSSSSEEDGIYFCGNSLGLQPKCAADYIKAQLDTWASVAVGGHFLQLNGTPLKPWQSMAENAAELSAPLIGARASEVAIQNTLSVNLHLLMASFYKPNQKKNKIMLEWKAFPSDHYIIESQILWHGFDPKEAMILLEPDQDHIISTDKILATIDKYADELALVLLPGIQYYSGQLFDIEKITAYAHSKNIVIGWDLAHAAGNVPMKMHDWDVDFAAWCTYKYMNAGPGSIGGLFVHEKHGKVETVSSNAQEQSYRHRLTGWYGGDQASRFQMDNNFRPIHGAGGFQISNPSAIDLTSLSASLSVFAQTSIEDLRAKSLQLTAYLEHLLLLTDSSDSDSSKDPSRHYRILTPTDPAQRGAQLSILLLNPNKRSNNLETVGSALHEAGIVVDQRKPDVIRVAPVPMYNSYLDVWKFVQTFRKAVL